MRRLPLYAERAIGELQAARGYTVTEFEKQFRAINAVSCKPGCSNCCHYPLLITVGEAIILYRFLAQKGRLTGVMRKKLQDHADLTSLLDPAVWMRSNISCPLLDTSNKCQGYEARPLACRLLVSADDPEACHPHAFNPAGMANTADVFKAVVAFETKLLGTHGMSSIRMPIGRAVLIADQVLTGAIQLNGIERALYKEYTGA